MRRWTPPRPAAFYGKTAARHTSRDFVGFLKEVVSLCLAQSADPHHPRQSLGSQNRVGAGVPGATSPPHVRFHFTPTYSSWLNQVELWFAKIEREVIARGVFTSVPDLARKAAPLHQRFTQPMLSLSIGSTPTLLTAFVVTISLRQATRIQDDQSSEN